MYPCDLPVSFGCPKCWFYLSYQDPSWCIPSGAEFCYINRIWCDLCFCLFNIFNGLYPLISVFNEQMSQAQCLVSVSGPTGFSCPHLDDWRTTFNIFKSVSLTNLGIPIHWRTKSLKNTENHRGYPMGIRGKSASLIQTTKALKTLAAGEGRCPFRPCANVFRRYLRFRVCIRLNRHS